MSIRPHRYFAILLAAGFASATLIALALFTQDFLLGGTNRRSQSAEMARKYFRQTAPAMPSPQSIAPSSFSANAILDAYPDRGPRMFGLTPNDQKVMLPMVSTDYEVDVRGDISTVTVRQTFKNPGDVPLNAVYQFPLAEDSAVFAMTMRVGDRRIRAVIQRKEEARVTYLRAKRQGKSAALLEQGRPNHFTQKVANLMPGHPVEVTLRYVQALPKIDGKYQLVLPLVVGPRYVPADTSDNFLVAGPDGSTDAREQQPEFLAVVSEFQAPETVDPDRVSIEVRIDGGLPVQNIASRSHRLFAVQLAPHVWSVELEKNRTIANKHFVLSYQLSGQKTDAGLLAFYDKNEQTGYFGLLIEPPATPAAEDIVPREMVFVVDCSGSMRGMPMKANKAFMRHALRNLRPSDTFRIVKFGGSASEYSDEPTPATPDNISEALAYVEGLLGSGGTNIKEGISRALDPDVPGDRTRLVTFLTDGYVGNEFAILRLLKDKIGQARLFAIGVGAGVNRYLLEEMGHMGRGFTRYIDPTNDVRAQAVKVAETIETPVLTKIRIDWGKLAPTQVTPQRIPDLFAGQSLRIMGTYAEPGTYTITVHGQSGRGPVSIPMQVTLPEDSAAGKAVELVWARTKIADYMRLLLTPQDRRDGDLTDEQIKNLVTSMGLQHSLVSQWTSFVAVSEQVVNPAAVAKTARVPVSKVAGVSPSAYPTAGTPNASGTPEPATWAGLLLAALAVLIAFRGRTGEDSKMIGS
jgi:Ca-activated chloride channel family protein